MRKFIHFLNMFAIVFLFSCSEMIQEGLESTEDPRVPEINIKQGSDNIASGDSADEIVGVKVNESSSEVSFTIENLGTADLVLNGDPIVAISGENADEFAVSEQPSSVISAGRNVVFTITFSPASTEEKTATIIIDNNDFDENPYTITITGRSKPAPDFITRLKKGYGPLTVTFTDRSIGDISSWEWDFDGDGSIDSTEQNPIFTYYETGVYSPVLTTSGPSGNDYCIKTGYITVAPYPKNVIDNTLNGEALSVYSADLDSDGDNDVVASGYCGIVWWENEGYGVFSTRNIIGTEPFENLMSVYASDVNNDDDNDLITTLSDDGEIVWWDNMDGNGNFDNNSYSISNSVDIPTSVYAAKINSDIYIDIIGGDNSIHKVFWWGNDGTPMDGGWSEYEIDGSFGATSVKAAFIDSDSNIDVICSGHWQVWGTGTFSEIAWWKNDGSPADGGWTKQLLDDDFKGASSVYVADIDGDGDTDILGTADEDNEIAFWRNQDGEGDFSTKIIISSNFGGASSVFADDMDNDGDNDILGCAGKEREIALWVNEDNQNFHKNIINNEFKNPNSIIGIDLNEDGLKDALVAGGDDDAGVVAWWDLNPPPIWDKHYITYFDGPCFIHTVDINSDGYVDIVGIAQAGNELAWWENNGNGTFKNKNTIDDENNINYPKDLYPVDIDNDGDIDLICSIAGSGFYEIAWWENTDGNGAFSSKQIIDGDIGLACYPIFPADIDNDGYVDIISGGSIPTGIIWWKNNGNKTFGISQQIQTVDNTVYLIHAAYINNDELIDIVYKEDEEIICLFNNGSASFTKDIFDPAFSSCTAIHSADIDGDNDIDLLGGSTTRIMWWENTDGNGVFSAKESLVINFRRVRSIFTNDIDADGDIDVIGAAQDDNSVIFLKNDGNTDDPDFIGQYLDTDFAEAYSVSVADIDCDGDADIIGAAKGDNEIVWWENNIKDYGVQ